MNHPYGCIDGISHWSVNWISLALHTLLWLCLSVLVCKISWSRSVGKWAACSLQQLFLIVTEMCFILAIIGCQVRDNIFYHNMERTLLANGAEPIWSSSESANYFPVFRRCVVGVRLTKGTAGDIVFHNAEHFQIVAFENASRADFGDLVRECRQVKIIVIRGKGANSVVNNIQSAQLIVVDASFSDVNDDAIRSIANNDSIQALCIDDTNVYEIDFGVGFNSLRSLYLSNAQISSHTHRSILSKKLLVCDLKDTVILK